MNAPILQPGDRVTIPGTAREAVTAGAALLDERVPGWWRQDGEPAISLSSLDLSDCSECVLGQLHPGADDEVTSYRAGLAAVGLGAEPDKAPGYGFEQSFRADYDELTSEWRQVIAGRRSSGRKRRLVRRWWQRLITARRAEARAAAGAGS